MFLKARFHSKHRGVVVGLSGLWLPIVFYAIVFGTLNDAGWLLVGMGILGGLVAVTSS